MKVGVLDFSHLKNDTSRKIIHIDMDAFYASVEMRDHPEWADKAVVMAKHPKLTHGRGIVSTCNYKARSFGIHSAMSAQKAYELCPDAIFVPVNMPYYVEISQQIRAIFARYTDVVEPMSVDEAFLDVTANKIGAKSAIYVARCIQRDIWEELRLTCSAGVSYNKFLAKVASDFQKPAGLTTIRPDQARDFLADLPIEKFYGVGVKSVAKLQERGIFYGRDVLAYDGTRLIEEFGRLGFLLLQRSQGIDNGPVRPQRQRKSIGTERTFYPELATDDQVKVALRKQADAVARQLRKKGMKGNVVTLKIRYADFETQTRQRKLAHFIDDERTIFQEAMDLWEDYGHLEQTVRLMGITVGGLEEQVREMDPLPLFDSPTKDQG